jgi:hypothetical protein
MSKLSVVLVLSLIVCPLLLVKAQGPAPELPAAPITPKVKTACLECHDSGILVQQRLDKKTWGKEVEKMTKWGALVEPQDRDAFIDYLATNFPADKEPAPPQYKAAPRAAKKATSESKH